MFYMNDKLVIRKLKYKQLFNLELKEKYNTLNSMLEVAKFIYNHDSQDHDYNYVISNLKKQLRTIKSKYLINE